MLKKHGEGGFVGDGTYILQFISMQSIIWGFSQVLSVSKNLSRIIPRALLRANHNTPSQCHFNFLIIGNGFYRECSFLRKHNFEMDFNQ